LTLADRGLDVDDARVVMAGPKLTLQDRRFDYPEDRFVTYGLLNGRLVMFAWTPTDDGIRVISMRNCHDKEYRKVAPRMG
jgi:uncharacterized protein